MKTKVDPESSPFMKSKMSMPQISNKNDKFLSTRWTSSSSMLPYITHSTINSVNSQKINSPPMSDWDDFVPRNRYGAYNIGSIRRNLEDEMAENSNSNLHLKFMKMNH